MTAKNQPKRFSKKIIYTFIEGNEFQSRKVKFCSREVLDCFIGLLLDDSKILETKITKA